MKKIFKRFASTTISVSALYLLFIVPAMVLFILMSYDRNSELADSLLIADIEKVKGATTRTINDYFDPMTDMALATAHLASIDTKMFLKSSISPYLIRMMLNNESSKSIFVGLKDGSYMQISRLQNEPAFDLETTLSDSTFLLRTTNRNKSETSVETIQFMDDHSNIVKQTVGIAQHDLRKLEFYSPTLALPYKKNPNETYLSDPVEIFSTDREQITVTAVINNNDDYQGVTGVSTTLQDFMLFLNRYRISPFSQTYIVNENFDIITTTDSEWHSSKRTAIAGKARTGLVNSVLAEAVKEYKKSGREIQIVRRNAANNSDDRGVLIMPFPEKYHKPWKVIVTVPKRDVVDNIDQLNHAGLVIGAGFLFVIIAFVLLLSKYITRPLSAVQRELSNLTTLRNLAEIPKKSRVIEVNALIESTNNVRKAISGVLLYIPRDLISHMLKMGWALKPGGMRKERVVMRTAITSDAGWANWSTPDQSISMISAYLDVVALAVKEDQGIIERFYGASSLSIWGLPWLTSNEVWYACLAAVRTKKRLIALNKTFDHQLFLPFSISLHKDNFLIGNMGSRDHLFFAVVGGELNKIRHLENINTHYKTFISISQSMYEVVKERILVRPIDKISIGGDPEMVYELLAVLDGDDEVVSTRELQERAAMTTVAYEFYAKGDFINAAHAYQTIAVRYHDGLSQVMIGKCQKAMDDLFPGDFELTPEILLPELFKADQVR